MIRRREFLGALGALTGSAAGFWPVALRAQQRTIPMVGYISGRSREGDAIYLPELLDGFKAAGLVDGATMTFEGRWTQGHYDQVPALMADLIGKGVAVIVALGTAVALSAKAATTTVPIVFISADDPVETGLVTSLNRPAGNVTGVSMVSTELRPKMLQILREIVPQMKTVIMLANPANSSIGLQTSDTRAAAEKMGLEMRLAKATSPADIDAAFAAIPREQGLAMMVASDPFLTSRHEQIVGAAAQIGLPAIYPWREYADNGGLISYGSSNKNGYRQAAGYAAKILAGAKPADLPVSQPTKFELVVNRKTAKTLGLTVPTTLIAVADEVID